MVYKMKKNKLLWIIALLAVCQFVSISCSSVRNRNAVKGKTSNEKYDKKSGSKAFKPKLEEAPMDRFSDTTVIYLNQVQNFSEENPFYNQYQNAVYLFNNEEFSQACNIFRNIADNYSNTDEVNWGSKFYLAECLILSNDYPNAEKVLLAAINSPDVSEEFMQQYLVRLGQTYCYLKKYTLAQRMFDRLKNEYPDSKYIKVAKCD